MHQIDCHILTLPSFPAPWVDAMRGDLKAQPVNQHWMPGIEGDLAKARAQGFAAGSAPFVSSADPDDRIMPGTYAALLKALADNPGAPFAWAGEKMVDEDLKDLPMRPHVWPRGYDPLGHISRANHVHGVKLYRREFVTPLLDLMRQAGPCCEFALDLAIAKPWALSERVEIGKALEVELSARHGRNQHSKEEVENFPPPAEGKTRDLAAKAAGFGNGKAWPVHVPIVGRLWRWHGQNGSSDFKPHHFERMAQVLGFASMNALQGAVVAAAHMQ